MSDTKFKEAKGALAFSQALVGQTNQPQMPQPQAQMGEQAPQPQPMQQEQQNPIEQAVKSAMEPYMQKIEAMIKERDDEPKDVTLQIEGEMKPKEETSE